MRPCRHPESLVRVVLVIVAAAVFVATSAFATQEIATKEELKCTACHVKKGRAPLNDKGKYYELKRTLVDYDLLIHVYKKCTRCHSREPGDRTLTLDGDMLKSKGVTMEHFGESEPAK
jgi:hypothetical protein